MESRISCFLCRAEDLECLVSIPRVVTCAHCRCMHVLKTDDHFYIRYSALAATLQHPQVGQEARKGGGPQMSPGLKVPAGTLRPALSTDAGIRMC